MVSVVVDRVSDDVDVVAVVVGVESVLVVVVHLVVVPVPSVVTPRVVAEPLHVTSGQHRRGARENIHMDTTTSMRTHTQ